MVKIPDRVNEVKESEVSPEQINDWVISYIEFVTFIISVIITYYAFKKMPFKRIIKYTTNNLSKIFNFTINHYKNIESNFSDAWKVHLRIFILLYWIFSIYLFIICWDFFNKEFRLWLIITIFLWFLSTLLISIFLLRLLYFILTPILKLDIDPFLSREIHSYWSAKKDKILWNENSWIAILSAIAAVLFTIITFVSITSDMLALWSSHLESIIVWLFFSVFPMWVFILLLRWHTK